MSQTQLSVARALCCACIPCFCSIIETYGKKVEPKELEEVLRLEYRSKLLNPRWAQAMASQGSGGAYEISTRMTALLGWGGTVGYTDSFAWDQVRTVGWRWHLPDTPQIMLLQIELYQRGLCTGCLTHTPQAQVCLVACFLVCCPFGPSDSAAPHRAAWCFMTKHTCLSAYL